MELQRHPGLSDSSAVAAEYSNEDRLAARIRVFTDFLDGPSVVEIAAKHRHAARGERDRSLRSQIARQPADRVTTREQVPDHRPALRSRCSDDKHVDHEDLLHLVA